MWATTWMEDTNDAVAARPGPPRRPFVWVDDEITDRDRAWVAAHHQGDALLHRVDPRRGLTDADFAVLDGWLGRVGAVGRA